jgi:hypothetical protein
MNRFVWLVAGACFLTPWAEAQVLTLDVARERALARQPALTALELNARALADAAAAERALPDPRLKFGLLNLPTRNFPNQSWEEMTQMVVSYEQMVPGGDKRRLREARMLAEADQARAESVGQRQRSCASRLAWVDAAGLPRKRVRGSMPSSDMRSSSPASVSQAAAARRPKCSLRARCAAWSRTAAWNSARRPSAPARCSGAGCRTPARS